MIFVNRRRRWPWMLAGALLLLWMLRDPELPTWKGALAPDEPTQVALPDSSAPIVHGAFTLTPRATFEITALVLGVERYRFDANADLSPYDVALGWSGMSDPALLSQLDISQSGRFFWVRWKQPLTVPQSEIFHRAANVHVIPATRKVHRQIGALRQWSVVQLRGQLVDASRADGFAWRTSQRRDDTGSGACELMLVEAVNVVRDA